MAVEPITPPVAVPPAAVTAPQAAVPSIAQLEADLSFLQRFVRADKGAVVGAVLHVAVLLVTAIGLHLSAKDTAILGSIVTVGVSYFLTVNFNRKKP